MDALFRKPRELITEKDRKHPPACLYGQSVKKLRNIWRAELDQLLTKDDSWGTKLVPLNKVFPKTPDRTQFRPIMVQSPIVKLLEARFLPKLQQYMVERMTKAQTGFVPQIGGFKSIWNVRYIEYI